MMLGLERDFNELMTTTITVYKKTGSNSAGEDTYSDTPTVYKAMVVRATKQIRTKDNAVKVSTAQVYLQADDNIDPDDKIVLPDGTNPVIMHIGAWSDEHGPYMQMVYT